MIQAVQKAGRNLIRDFGELENLQVSQKGAADFASSADINTEKTLREYLLKVRPRYGFLQEESGEIAGLDTSHRWIIDPLDGTTNFLHAIPHFAISLALQEDQEIIAGVIYNPITNDLYYAEKGNGAWALTPSGSTRLHVSGRTNLNEALVATGIPYLGHGDTTLFKRQLDIMMKSTCGVRRMGAASLDLAYLAAGKFECYWEKDIKPWDIAAGLLLVKEAGGRICDFDGEESFKHILNSNTVIATNSYQYDSFRKILLETL
ncbi:MAG: inositol monophosphatase [Alphaproteobacteria bacterium]|nr:inositol monophosphatase [Alphaproteobacteria bacterium]